MYRQREQVGDYYVPMDSPVTSCYRWTRTNQTFIVSLPSDTHTLQLGPLAALYSLYCYSLLITCRVTKASFTCAVIYSLNELKVLHFAREDLCLWAAILLVSLKVYSVLIAEIDPFNLPANTLWSVVTCVSPSRETPTVSANPANQKLKSS